LVLQKFIAFTLPSEPDFLSVLLYPFPPKPARR
jgi:hypothetical protein